MASGQCKLITLKRGDDVIGWIDYRGVVPSAGDEITIPLADVSYAGEHSVGDLSGPGLFLEFQDDQGNALAELNGAPAFMDLHSVAVKLW